MTDDLVEQELAAEDAFEEEVPKVWAVKMGDKVTQIRDLPVGTIDRIARDNVATWVRVVGVPLSDLAVAEQVLREVAKWIGYKDLPPAGQMTVRYILDNEFFIVVDDDIPVSNRDPEDRDPPTGAAT